MAKLHFAFSEKVSLDNMLHQILDIQDALVQANSYLILEGITLDSSTQENINETYLEKLISRVEVIQSLRKYSKKGHLRKIYGWFKEDYPYEKYPQIPLSTFVYDLHNKYGSYLEIKK